MKSGYIRIMAAFLALLMLFTTFTACGDVNVGDVDVGDVDLGGVGNGSGNNSGGNGASNTYTVIFNNWDGSTIKVQTGVKSGEAATAPEAPAREGYTFVGWDKAFNNVTADITVTANYVITTVPGPVSCVHSMVYTMPKAAGCTEEGNIGYWSCTVCKKSFADMSATDEISLDQIVVAAAGHELNSIDKKDASCEEDGNIAYWYCKVCRSCYTDEFAENEIVSTDMVITALGHTVVIDEAVAPTYEASGLKEGSHCSVCNKTIVKQETIPPLKVNYHSITYKNLKGAAVSDEYSRYAENAGFDLPENITVDGYKFEGWYTKPEGGEKVIYIPKGSTEEYVLYAHWSLIEYKIVYKDAPKNSNRLTYTYEDEVILYDPEWSGLEFTHWTDKNGNTVDKIAAGTVGNIELTANWKSVMNTAISKTGDRQLMIEFDSQSGMYYFIYELGTIQNVVLDDIKAGNQNSEYDLHIKTTDADRTLTIKEIVTVNENRADGISNTVSNSVTQSDDYSEVNQLASSNSKTHSWSISSELKIGKEDWPIGGSIGSTDSNSSTSGTSTEKAVTTSILNSYEDAQSLEISSVLEYSKTLGKEKEVSVTVSGDMPNGFYGYVHAGNIKVYAVAAYDIENERCEFTTYSILDNVYELLLYARDAEELNSQACEALDYDIPIDEIKALVDSSFYVDYSLISQDTDGAAPVEVVNPNPAVVFYKDGGRAPAFAAPARSEYDEFLGWYADPEFTALVNEAWINEWCENEERGNITLYAKWDLAAYYDQINGQAPRWYNASEYKYTRVALDFSSVSADAVFTANESADNWFDICSVTDLYLVGHPNAVYTIELLLTDYAEGAEMTIHLDNFNMKGTLLPSNYNTETNKWQNSDQGMKLTINVSGNCSITARANSTPIESFEDVTFIGNGNFTAKGCDGTNASSGGQSGGDGRTAINIGRLTVDMPDGSFTAIGGNGGNGAQGKKGVSGKTNDEYDFVEDVHHWFTGHIQTIRRYRQAYAGEKGGKGGKGGDGGLPVILSEINAVSGQIYFIYGDGGNGGKGGDGGDGGKGHDYYGEVSGVSFLTCYDPGQGGNAGNGGDGGNAGHSVTKSYNFDSDLIEIVTGSNGKAGVGGDPGKVGKGGIGGSTSGTANSHSAENAADGWQGQRGASGSE